MAQKFANNAVSKLAAPILATDLSCSVTPGDGAKFPTLSGGDYFMATLVKSTGDLEIVKVTALATDTLTIVRAQEGTAAIAFSAGDRIEARLTKGSIDGMVAATATAQAAADAAQATANNAWPHGQCQLVKSGANLLLQQKNGDRLIINGVVCKIPSAGVTLAPTGLTPTTLYYIYARDADGDGIVDTLEPSTIVPTTDPHGISIKTGDATRTLVGMAYLLVGPVFSDSPSTGRLVLSYFNRVGKEVSQRILSPVSTTSAGSTIISTALNCPFLTWGDECVMCSADGGVRGSNVNATMYTGHSFDGNLSGELNGTYVQAGVINYDYPVALSLYKVGLSEGYHYSTLLGNVTGGYTATWAANSLYNRVLIRG